MIRGNVLFGIRGDLARFCGGIGVAVAVRKRVASFVIFIMVLLFWSLCWITFSNSASRAVAKDSTIQTYVSMESRLSNESWLLHLKSLEQISFFAILWRFLAEFQELSARSVKPCLHF